MSLTSFIKRAEVAARCKPLRPKLPRKIGVSLKVAPRTKHYGLVGTAFDYLLRFELQRRAPHAVAEKWVAEHVNKELFYREFTSDGGKAGMTLFDPYEVIESLADEVSRMPEDELDEFWTDDMKVFHKADDLIRKVIEHAGKVNEQARLAVATYVATRHPSPEEVRDVARHAVRLAKLDPIFRAGSRGLDQAIFEQPDPEDVENLLGMLGIVPIDSLIHGTMVLSPTFGESSMLVGGADTDLITGNMLVDFKTTKADKMDAEHLDQLLGYLILARNERMTNPALPEIERLGLYFCRHGHLWTADAVVWTLQPEFPEFEKWFVQHAKEVFGAPK